MNITIIARNIHHSYMEEITKFLLSFKDVTIIKNQSFKDLNDETKNIVEANYKLEYLENKSYINFNSLKKIILD